MIYPADRLETLARLRTAVEEWMTVTGHSFEPNKDDDTDDIPQPPGTVRLRGTLKQSPDIFYKQLRQRCEALGYTAFLRPLAGSNQQKHEVIAVPGLIPKNQAQNNRTPVLLFLFTALSVFLMGALTSDGLNIGDGLMYAGTLLGILGAHEAGHFLVGKWRGQHVSLPYFIPFPFSLFGTLGAVIVQREPFEDRRKMLEIGIAGPIAGFLVAVPLYLLGISLSEIKEIPKVIPDGSTLIGFGDSLFTHLVGVLQFGWIDPRTGYDVFLHPIATGAWLGLLLTGINLIPAGQLDGGHIAAAFFGKHAKYVSYAMIAVMIGLAFISSSWIIWAVLLLLFGRSHPPALNTSTKLTLPHHALGVIALLMIILVFVPNPIY